MGHLSDVSPSQSLGLVLNKLSLTQQKHAFTNRKKCTTAQNNHKKLKPGLVAFTTSSMETERVYLKGKDK